LLGFAKKNDRGIEIARILNMEKISLVLASVFLSAVSIAQNPEYVDPGNSRGDEDTLYLWENPTYYVPVLVIIVLLVGFAVIKRTRKNKS
jgi:hypothetical protein